MSDRSFTTTFVVDQTPGAVFEAINNVREWWSQDVEGPTDHLGAEFSYRYLDVHRCQMKIVEFVPGEKVVWHCLDNYFSFTKDPTEWVDTRVAFEISKQGKQTHVRFTHAGLVPEYECFDVCTNAWGGYVGESLKALITTGQGARNNEARNAEAQAQYR
jgi:hypothetical protein